MPDINISNNTDWVSVNALSGIAVGVAAEIQNKWWNWGLLQESATKPDITDFSGIVITEVGSEENNKRILEGSSEVWVRAYFSGYELKFHVGGA